MPDIPVCMQLCHGDCNRQQLLSQRSLSAHDLTIPVLGHKPFCNTPQIPPRLDLHHVARRAQPTAEQTIHLCALAVHLALAIRKLRESEHSQRSFSYCVTQKLSRNSHSAPQQAVTRFAEGSKALRTCCTTLPGGLSLGAHRAEHGSELGHSQVELAINLAGERKETGD